METLSNVKDLVELVEEVKPLLLEVHDQMRHIMPEIAYQIADVGKIMWDTVASIMSSSLIVNDNLYDTTSSIRVNKEVEKILKEASEIAELKLKERREEEESSEG